MIDPDTLLGQLVTKLRDIPALVALVSSSNAITGYSPEWPTSVDMFQAIRDMPKASILVAWMGTAIGDRSNGIEHQFSAYLRPNGKVSPMFVALREGVVTTSGQKFKRTQVSPLCHPTDVRGCFTRQLAIGEAIFEYHEVPLRITERGVDS